MWRFVLLLLFRCGLHTPSHPIVRLASTVVDSEDEQLFRSSLINYPIRKPAKQNSVKPWPQPPPSSWSFSNQRQCLFEGGKELSAEFRTNFFVMKRRGLKLLGRFGVKPYRDHPSRFRICFKTSSAGSSWTLPSASSSPRFCQTLMSSSPIAPS